MDLSRTLPTQPVFLGRDSTWFVGLDLGQARDFTAIAALELVRGVNDPNSEWERHHCIGRLPQTKAERIYLRGLRRLPLGTSYPQQVEIVRALMSEPPLSGEPGIHPPATLVIDNTEVGRAVSDIFAAAGLKHQAVTITSSNEAVHAGRPNSWHVGKQVLTSIITALMHTGGLKFALPESEAAALKEELSDFRRKLSDSGRATYAARTGATDDLILAIEIGCWYATRPPPSVVSFGVYGTPDPPIRSNLTQT